MDITSQKVEQLFKAWERLDILAGEEGEQGKYEARIEDFINGGIVITPPQFVSGGTRLRDNMQVIVHFTRDDAAYQFHSRIRTRELRGTRQMVLTPPARIQRVQRRMFVRVETNSIAEYVKVGPRAELEDWEEDSRWTRTYCINISGGGALIDIIDGCDAGDRLLLRMEFLNRYNLPSPVAAVARRVVLIEMKKCLGVEFILAEKLRNHFKQDVINQFPEAVRQFDRARREVLVAGIFAEQIEMRKKGLL